MQKMRFGIVGMVAALAACGSGSSSGSGGAGGSGGAASTGSSGPRPVCQAGFDGTVASVNAILKEGISGFSYADSFSLVSGKVAIVYLSESKGVCGGTEKACTMSIGCSITAKTAVTVVAGTYDASGFNEDSNPGGAQVVCYAQASSDCQSQVDRPATTGSTMTLTAVDGSHVKGTVSLIYKGDDGTPLGNVEVSFDAAACNSPHTCVL